MPDIHEYYDFRVYLRDLFLYKKELLPVFSNRYIIQKAGFSSPSMLKNVICGKRNISLKAAERFAQVLGLSNDEQSYFLKLVAFNQATSLSQKERNYEELQSIRIAQELPKCIGKNPDDYLSSWWNPVLREALVLPDVKNSSKWLGKAICPPVSALEIKRSIALLKRIGLIKKSNGKWQQTNAILATDPQLESVKAAQFHRQMIQLGLESIVRFAPQEREISGTTLRIAKKDVPQFVNLMRDFRKKLLQLAEVSEPADQVYQFNCQFFPVVAVHRPRRIK